MFREGVRVLLSNEPDFEVVGEAGTAREAVELAFTLEPDLILIDILLQDEPELDVIKTIHLQQPDTNIVILTTNIQDELLLSAIRYGAKGYILKNLSIHNLIASIRGLERGEMALSRSIISRIFDKLIVAEDDPEPQVNGMERLSRREREVLTFLAKGDSNREIAEQLVISENTVKKHVRSILDKLHQKNRNQISLMARHWSLSHNENDIHPFE